MLADFFVGKIEGKTEIERCKRMWEDIIQMDLKGIGWSGMDWINQAQDRDLWLF
jgi:hypothetical protein